MTRVLLMAALALALSGCAGLAAFSSALDGVMQPQQAVVYQPLVYEEGPTREMRCWQLGWEYRCREL